MPAFRHNDIISVHSVLHLIGSIISHFDRNVTTIFYGFEHIRYMFDLNFAGDRIFSNENNRF